MWTDGNGCFYFGDCRTGDRAATGEEIAAYEAGKAPAEPTPMQKLAGLLVSKNVITSEDADALDLDQQATK